LPAGIVLEEDKAGNIFIAEVFPNGNAFNSGLVDAGDQLIAVSAGMPEPMHQLLKST
jgi:C-terminal processing protease CtpA/Prc